MKIIIILLYCLLPTTVLAFPNQREFNIDSVKITHEAFFPGGLAEWKNYIEKSMAGIEIDSAAWDGKTITLMVSFIIEKDGSVSGVSISNARKYPKVLVKETMHIIKNSPKWLPAMKEGKPIRSYFRQPVICEVEAD